MFNKVVGMIATFMSGFLAAFTMEAIKRGEAGAAVALVLLGVIYACAGYLNLSKEKK